AHSVAILSDSAAGGDSSGGCGQLLFDFFVHARAAKFGCYADCVLDGVRVRTTVSNNGDATDAEKRRAAILCIISALSKRIKCFLGKSVADLRSQAALDRLLQHAADVLNQTFTQLQSDVADKTVANDHINIAAENIAAFDVTHKV